MNCAPIPIRRFILLKKMTAMERKKKALRKDVTFIPILKPKALTNGIDRIENAMGFLKETNSSVRIGVSLKPC